jgi:isopenicillin-N N-acyltransferase-like protein
MKTTILSIVCLLGSLSSGLAAYCGGSPDPGERTNEFPIYDEPLRFVRSVKNAMLFEAGPPNATIPVVHLWGTPYEVGYAQGELMGPMLKEFVYRTWYYISSELVAALSGPVLPQWAKRALVQKTLDRSLDWTAEMTANFTSQAYFDEARGIADATGIDYNLLWRLNMFPELTKAQCSFFGAWENAVG